MNDIRKLIHSRQLPMTDLPFCSALNAGRFGREEILRAEIVELYRAINTRASIQNAYKKKLRDGISKNLISPDDVKLMEVVIDDEGETDEHIDHLDMRFKLFVGTPISNKSKFRRNPELEAINNEWMNVCNESSLYALMAVTAAIEDWYAPVSAFFETAYRSRGFSDDELELFIVHKGADIDHSEAQFDILNRNQSQISVKEIDTMLQRTFKTSWGYDDMKLKFALSNRPLTDFIE